MQLTEYNLLNLPSHSAAMAKSDYESLLDQLPNWQIAVVEGIPQLQCNYKFINFVEAMDFANKITVIAEQADHHPCLCVEWGKVAICWWSHNLKGLQLKDFIMAATTEQIYSSQ
jgi:4a-hydroxytetrahydrobiopterin dehydratase